MPDEAEIPTETLQDKIEEVRADLNKVAHEAKEWPWITYLAVTTALMAVLAAVSSLLSGQTADDALLRANDAVYYEALAVDAWSEFQADSIKAIQESTTAVLLTQMGAPGPTIAAHTAEAARRKANQASDQATATGNEARRDRAREESDADSQRRQRFAFAVTLFQVGIGLSAVAALVRRRVLWYLSMAGAVAGIILLVSAFTPVTGHARPPGGPAPAAADSVRAGGTSAAYDASWG